MPNDIDALFLAFQEALAGRYSLEQELGRGGMGVVYLAREVRLDRRVAIKLLPPEFAAQPVLRDRFMREARTAARLSHPYIVPIYSVDEAGDFVFYVMAYVDGETLAQRVATRGPLPPADAMRILREVAWALAYAHEQGIVHRDVKPANILIERGTERAMVTDFGIARLTAADGHTAVGELLGTPEYMSPEQASGEPVDGRSDLYSLGVVGYFALTGTVPFSGGVQAVLAQQITKPAPLLASLARGAPRAITDALDRCLAKNPAERFATGGALADALAPALVKGTDIPVPLRVFIEKRRQALLLLLPYFVSVMGIMAFVSSNGHPLLQVLSVALIGAGLLSPVGLVVYRLRRLASLGYGPRDIAGALRIAAERKREEFLYEFGAVESTRERLLRLGGNILMGLGGVALVATLAVVGGLLPGSLLSGAASAAPPLIGLGVWGIAATAVANRWKRLRNGAPSLLSRFWDGRVGRALGKVAEFRLRGRAVASDRPTEIAIAMSADDLFAALPKDIRQRLGDVPEVLKSLQQRASAVRDQIAKLDESIAAASRGPARESARDKHDALAADLRDARAQAESRLSELVTALETVRLDMLRLKAGVGSVEHITLDLVQAQEVGAEAQRLIDGRREVEQVVARK